MTDSSGNEAGVNTEVEVELNGTVYIMNMYDARVPDDVFDKKAEEIHNELTENGKYFGTDYVDLCYEIRADKRFEESRQSWVDSDIRFDGSYRLRKYRSAKTKIEEPERVVKSLK